MKFGHIENPDDFFHQLGLLHDARIESFEWVPPKRQVLIKIDDLNSNFLGLSEYEGLLPATLVFSNVKKVIIGINPVPESFYIYDLETSSSATHINVVIKFSPGGKMEFTCGSIEVQKMGNS